MNKFKKFISKLLGIQPIVKERQLKKIVYKNPVMDVIVSKSENDGMVVPMTVIPPIGTNIFFSNDAHLYEVSNVAMFIEPEAVKIHVKIVTC